MARILWLASYPKSGNTWLRAIIDCLLSEGGSLDLNALPPAFNGVAANYVEARGIELPFGVQGAVSAHWGAAQAFVVAQATRERVYLKTHNVCARFNGQLFPNPALTERAIYLVRDPRDVAISYAYHFECPLEAAVSALCDREKFITRKGGPAKAEMLSSWGAHVRSWTAQRHFPVLALRYEGMCENPAKAVTSVSRYLGLERSVQQIARVVEATGFDNLKQRELREGFKEAVREGGFFRKGRAQQWREIKDPAVFDPLIREFRPLMTKLGYPA